MPPFLQRVFLCLFFIRAFAALFLLESGKWIFLGGIDRRLCMKMAGTVACCGEFEPNRAGSVEFGKK